MPIRYVPTWQADVGQDASTVLGDENTVLGDENDSAAAFFELLTGTPPYMRLYQVVELMVGGADHPMHVRTYQRNDIILRITLIDDAGDVVKLEDASLTYTAGPITKTTGGGGIAIVDKDGIVEVTLTHVDTNLAPGQYRSELLLTDVGGARYTAGIGLLWVIESITAGSD